MTKGERSAPSDAEKEGKKRAPAPRPRPKGEKSEAGRDMGVEALANLRIGDAPAVTADADGARPKLKIPAPIGGATASAVPAPLPAPHANGAAREREKPRRARGGKGKGGGERDRDEAGRAADGAAPPAPREPRRTRAGESREAKENGKPAANGDSLAGEGEKAKKEGGKRGARGGKAEEGASARKRRKSGGPKESVATSGGSRDFGRCEARDTRALESVSEGARCWSEGRALLPVDTAGSRRKTTPADKTKSEKKKDKSDKGPDSVPAGAYVPPSRRAAEPAPRDEKKKKKKDKSSASDSNGDAQRGPNDSQSNRDGQAPRGDGGGGKSAAGKEIRRCVEAGNVGAAMQAFDLKASGGNVDVDTARVLLMGLVRACHLHEALHVADYLKDRKLKLPLKHFTAVILATSQRANPMDALDLLNALEGSVAYESRAIHNYHFHFAKLIVQEFLEEALQTLDRVANAPAFGLQENGLAAMDVVVRGGGKGGSLSLDVPALGEELKRGLMKGDTVLLSRTGEAARTMGSISDRGGFTGEMPTGPRGGFANVEMGSMPTGPRGDSTAAPVGGRGGRAGGGWRADYEFEAEVSATHPNLSVKLIGCDATQSASVRGGGWRVDKLANRTSFVRQLNAMQDMMEVKQGTSQKAGVDSAIRDVLVAGWDGNKAARDAVPDMCAEERHGNLNVIQRQKVIDQAMDLQAMSHMNKSQTDALEGGFVSARDSDSRPSRYG
jgi:hypothetical protein